MTAKEFRIWVTTVVLDFAFYICPEGRFKRMFASFLNNNIYKIYNDDN